MARGWESKSVEAQQEDAVARKPDSGQQPPSPEDVQRRQHKETLRLARARVLQQMQASQDTRYVEMLQKSLAALDRQIGGS
jgi:hypothetical protein